MNDYGLKVFKEVGGWAIGTDGMQWVAMYRHGKYGTWEGKVFVSSDRIILECRMKEIGVPEPVRKELLFALPETFQEWINDDQQARYRDTRQKSRIYSKRQAAIDLGHSKPAKSGQSHRKPRRVQSGESRGRRR